MKINIKSNKGVTITGLVIYVSSFLMICLVIGVITTFFFNNTKFLSSEATASAEYDILNAYLAKDAKKDGVSIEIDSNGNWIRFSNGNQYIYIPGNDYGQIYLCNTQNTPNKYFIVANYINKKDKNEGNKIFSQGANNDSFIINIEILNKLYTQTYNLKK